MKLSYVFILSLFGILCVGCCGFEKSPEKSKPSLDDIAGNETEFKIC